MKTFFKVIAASILGYLFSGGIDLDDLKFQRNMRKLKKEKWFKKLSDNGMYYDSIYQNDEFKTYLTEDGIVNRILNHAEEREKCLAYIKRGW